MRGVVGVIGEDDDRESRVVGENSEAISSGVWLFSGGRVVFSVSRGGGDGVLLVGEVGRDMMGSWDGQVKSCGIVEWLCAVWWVPRVLG